MGRLIGRRPELHVFAGPLPAVWSAMADTARYNAAAALPRQTITERARPDGSVRLPGACEDGALHARMGGPALQLGPRALVPASPSFSRGPLTSWMRAST